MHFGRIFVILLFPILIMSGCATSNYSRGHNALMNENYELAWKYLKRAIAEDIYNARAVRDIGIAAIARGQLDNGIKFLRTARLRMPHDPVSLYYLGLAYELKGDTELAITTYRYYRDVTTNRNDKKHIEAKLQSMIKSFMTGQIHNALRTQAASGTKIIPKNSIAVWYFQNIGDTHDLTPLQKGLTDLIISDLSKINNLLVIERIKLQILHHEMGKDENIFMRKETAPIMGKLLGVARLVYGTFFEYANEEIRIDATLFDIKTAELRSMESLQGKIKNIFKLEKDLVFRVLKDLEIDISQKEHDTIMTNPTENILAFLAYSNGLDFEDKGEFDSALAAYQEAVNLDKKFNLAKQAILRVEARQMPDWTMPNPGGPTLPILPNSKINIAVPVIKNQEQYRSLNQYDQFFKTVEHVNK